MWNTKDALLILFPALLGLSSSSDLKTYIATWQTAPLARSMDMVSEAGVSEHQDFNISSFHGFIFKGDATAASKLGKQEGLQIYEDGQFEVGLSPTWGLDRINQRDLPLDGNEDYNGLTGEGVTAYILDTGIKVDHPEFEGRASWGATFADNKDEDCNGHGTHVAGTVMSKTYGVAKKAKAVAVKVLDCGGSGYWSDFILGIEWIVKDAQAKGIRGVINMSIQGGKYDPANAAVNAAVDAGLFVAVCAGNYHVDACGITPASAEKAVTVTAADSEDTLASFGDYGECVDLAAPGLDITSTYTTSPTMVLSGCSMATPHVAGVMCLLLEKGQYTPEQLANKLYDLSTKDRLKGLPDSPPTKNRILYVEGAASPSDPCLPANENHGKQVCQGPQNFIMCSWGTSFSFSVPAGTKCVQTSPTTIRLDYA